jgi:hypothetical protein
VGCCQSEIQAFEAGRREAYHEPRGTKEDYGNAAEEMSAGEGKEGRLARRRQRREEGREHGGMEAINEVGGHGRRIRTGSEITLPPTPFPAIRQIAALESGTFSPHVDVNAA